jgi:16S rRNA (cytidine1402-2'-O)-methyltransferase
MSNTTILSSDATPLDAALYVVATPIGNLQDITLRAIQVLRQVDVIAAEDTRHSAALLKHYAISAPMLAVHEHNEQKAAHHLLEKIQQGAAVALITDAGTPAISDPGALVVNLMLKSGVKVVPIPGASAVTAAMSVAGIFATAYQFYGFLPASSKQRQQVLTDYLDSPHSLVFYEAPHRIMACLQDLISVCGEEREIMLARELTKQYETLYRATVAEVIATLQNDPQQQRGEFVLILLPQEKLTIAQEDSQWQQVLAKLLAELPLKQAVKLCADITGAKKNLVYEFALKMKQDD